MRSGVSYYIARANWNSHQTWNWSKIKQLDEEIGDKIERHIYFGGRINQMMIKWMQVVNDGVT